MNWGLKITILYLSFVALILTLVFNCMTQKVELESPDYYANELAYQDKIDAINNANAVTTIEHSVSGKNIALKISTDMLSKDFEGDIYFYRPSNSANDFKLPMKFNAAGEQLVNAPNLIHGIYKMQLSWQTNGKKYFKEEIINIK